MQQRMVESDRSILEKLLDPNFFTSGKFQNNQYSSQSHFLSVST